MTGKWIGSSALAGAKEVSAMRRFGSLFGMSFQIVDDIIDHSDYAKAFGIEKARKYSKELIEKAKVSLKIFGKKAHMIKEIADYILAREI
jgi:geranylgeranyl pyrophosphate synthase